MVFTDMINRTKERVQLPIFSPAVNIREADAEIVLEAEMPDLEKENINVEVQGDELEIKAERRVDIPKDCSALWQERRSVEYKRVFSLGAGVDRGSVHAEYGNGILTVRLTKTADAQPRKIQIN